MLHEFDAAGRHLDSRISAAKTVADGPAKAPVGEAAQRLLHEWLDALPGRHFTDIAIAPCAVEADGTRFGLVRECHGEHPEAEEQDDRAEFHPTRLEPARVQRAVGRLVRHLKGRALHGMCAVPAGGA
ncbi:hypothetical protein ACWEN3_32170 [Streptomyces sp. NPDC004561]